MRASPEPVPTATLVITDVVGSTKLASALGDAANAALWDRHDRVARDLVAEHGGREVERTDGILVLFEGSERAIDFALAYREALDALDPPLEVRIGLHRGALVVRDNPADDVARGAKPVEADGLSLSVAARVGALAEGGQILLTGAAVPAGGSGVVARGHWRLKGAPEPVELFELAPTGVGPRPIADGDKAYRVVRDGDLWVPVREIPRALPSEWDPFVGRAENLRELESHLEAGARLVSVTGVGGTGKTRLVTRFGWVHLAAYPGGVWFCDLSEARDLDDIVRAVAAALGVPLGPNDSVTHLAHAIAGRGRCLVVLDNFEQVAKVAADVLSPWLAECPDATYLVTTRARLGLPGEVNLSVPPLGEDEAVALFTTRAAAAAPDFELPPEELDDVRALVGLLDRLPLAIELAASRVRIMSPRALRARMAERFELLAATGGRGDRQATLRTTLDWSWDLLEGEARAGLAQLSVFEGGFTLAAAEAVLDGGATLDVVQGLVDQSLVRRAERDRFDLLAVVKAYAAERLDGLELRAPAELRHGAYYAALGQDREAPAREMDNIVAACRRAISREDADVALPTLRAAWWVAERQGPVALAATLAADVGELPGLAPGVQDRLRAEALLARGSHVEGQAELRLCLRRLGYPEPSGPLGLVARIVSRGLAQLRRRLGASTARVRADLEVVMAATRAYQRLVETYWFSSQPPRMLASALSALHLCEPLGPSPELARAYATLALATSGLRFDATADRYAALALQTAEGTDAPVSEAYVRFLACVYRVGHGRWAEVEHDLPIAQALFARVEDHRLLGDARTVQGMVALYRGDFDAAHEVFAEVLRSGRRIGNAQHQVWGLVGGLEVELRHGDLEAASARIAELDRVLADFPSPLELARARALAALVALERGDEARARGLAEQAQVLLRKLGPPTAHYLLESYAATAEVLIRVGARSGGALRLMRRFAKTFPIGAPRLAGLEALAAQARGRAGAADRAAQRGQAAAEQLGMTYERERLAR